ncbi:MAG: hypothetical protein R3F23_08060 [Verrucomicrobiia bacterium]
MVSKVFGFIYLIWAAFCALALIEGIWSLGIGGFMPHAVKSMLAIGFYLAVPFTVCFKLFGATKLLYFLVPLGIILSSVEIMADRIWACYALAAVIGFSLLIWIINLCTGHMVQTYLWAQIFIIFFYGLSIYLTSPRFRLF